MPVQSSVSAIALLVDCLVGQGRVVKLEHALETHLEEV